MIKNIDVTYMIVIATAAAQKWVFEYVSASILEIICLEHVGHTSFIGCGPGFEIEYFFIIH